MGTTVTLTYTASVNQFAPQTNTAAITAADETDLGTQLSASVTVNPQEVDLSVTKTVNKSTPNVGSNVIYTVTVSNAASYSTATDVLLSDLLPAGETLVSATPSVGTYNASTGIWSLQDFIVWPDGSRLHGYGHYHETYALEGGEWRIASSTLTEPTRRFSAVVMLRKIDRSSDTKPMPRR